MEAKRIPADIIDVNRLEAEFYNRKFLEADHKIRRLSFTVDRLRNLVTDLKDGPGGWGVSTEDYVDLGVPVIRTVNIFEHGVQLDDCVFISEQKHQELLSHEVVTGDVLLTVRGTIGKSTVFNVPNFAKANLNAAVARMRCRKGLDSYYLVIFFNSYYGRTQSERLSNGAVQKNMNLSETGSHWIPKPIQEVQFYIGNKLRLASQLRVQSQKLAALLQQEMQPCFRGEQKPSPSKHSWAAPDILTPNRLESEFYSRLVLWADREIKSSQWKHKRLSDIAFRVKDGPGGWGVSTSDYVSAGVPVIRAINLIDGECDLTDCIYISHKKHLELNSHKVNQNSVLLSVRGTIGRAAVFTSEDYKEANLNAAVVTIDCRDDILPHFLAEFLNTEIGRIQTQRMANGAVQNNMNLEETGNNLIIVPPKDFQEKIVGLRQTRLALKEFSKRLTTAAKFLVEALIEGKVTEDELKTAQEALQRGDREPDQLILSRLTRKGFDVKGEPQLFPDLDTLYEAIHQLDADSEEEL